VEASTSTLHITPPHSPAHSPAPLESTPISDSSFEEDKEEDIDVGEYGGEDVTSLEEIFWPQECLHNVHTYTTTIHQIERERKRRKLTANSLLQGGIAMSL
jgi:hypothetical protein